MWVITGSLVAFWIAASVLALALCISAGQGVRAEEPEILDAGPADLRPLTFAGAGVVGADAAWSGAALAPGDAQLP